MIRFHNFYSSLIRNSSNCNIGIGAFAAEVGAWNRERWRPMRGEGQSEFHENLGEFYVPPSVQPRWMGRLRPLQVDVS